jgi:hypothetical protein
MREEHIESRLLTLVETVPFAAHQRRIDRLRQKRGMLPLTISFSGSHLTSSEQHHGADIGLVATIDVPGELRLTKASLVQGKRLTPTNDEFSATSEYSQLFESSPNQPPQWRRMLEVTSASEYFLYGPTSIPSRRGLIPLGTRVISAQTVQGMADGGHDSLTAAEATRRGKPLANWLVEDFLCCQRGDTAPWTIETARGRSADFPVGNQLEINVTISDRDFGRFR